MYLFCLMRNVNSNLEIKNPKSWIIYLLLNGPISINNLKDKFVFEKGLQLKDFYYHMNGYGKKELGLKSSKVIKEKNGILFLNIESLDTLVKLVEILLKDSELGSKMKYLLSRAFIEAFFYYKYGDNLYFTLSGKYYNFIKSVFPEITSDEMHELDSRVFNLNILEKHHIFQEEKEKVYNFFKDKNIIEILIEYVKKYREITSVKDQIAYILNVIFSSVLAEKIEKETKDALPYVHASDFSLAFKHISEIKETIENLEKNKELKDLWNKTINIFLENIILRVFTDNISIDNSLSQDYKVLNLYEGSISFFIYEFDISLWNFYFGFYYSRKEFKTREEHYEFLKERVKHFNVFPSFSL